MKHNGGLTLKNPPSGCNLCSPVAASSASVVIASAVVVALTEVTATVAMVKSCDQ